MHILLADNHPLILWAFQALLEDIRPGVTVRNVCTPAELREAMAHGGACGLVLLDLQLGAPGEGYALLAELRINHPEVPVVVSSATDHAADVIQSIDLGACGYLPKRMSTGALADALRLILDGGIFVPPMGLPDPLSTRTSLQPAAGTGHGEAVPYQTLPSFETLGLTPRQADVLSLLLQGKPNKEIARRLGLSVETVKDHVQAVLRALGVNSRTQAVLAVSQLGAKRNGPAAVTPLR
ncbi:LuxR C-terminal-related transcriptional regulator [Ideonella oryzae]|uniref:Response regulator transcription factor n=1 Tax=Ideonella oryzae TaxID=2937441 RepID=A0ABT1BKN3_9BURK|nr:response regulator transcription factor [Ideonella oryzae]MCO5976772.1 response regulator transcription factor [Ideonella oryzae]